jgi:UDP-3-O-acyl-N-acetylglucosamine deacetylase
LEDSFLALGASLGVSLLVDGLSITNGLRYNSEMVLHRVIQVKFYGFLSDLLIPLKET